MAVYIIKTKTIFFSKINGLISKYSDRDVYWETLYKEGGGSHHTAFYDVRENVGNRPWSLV